MTNTQTAWVARATRRNVDNKPDYPWLRCYASGAPVFYETEAEAYAAAASACADPAHGLHSPRSERIEHQEHMWNIEQMRPNNEREADRLAILRAALRRRYGCGRYRIIAGGEVHIYGPMPNAAHVTGWWLLGDIARAEQWIGLERAPLV